MAGSLKDHSDTWVNATTFIHTANAHSQGPRGSHSVQALQQTRLVLHRGAPPSSQFVQAESAGRSICSGGRATTWQDLLYSGERDPLASTGHTGESPLMPACVAHERWRTLESTLCWVLGRCPFYMSFSSRVFPLTSFSPLLVGFTLGCKPSWGSMAGFSRCHHV
jgi:hypothetical protein